MIARYASSDVNVIALIGERGREVREFIEHSLDAAARERTVLVVATSDQPALLRIKAAWVATAIGEWFRERGRNVLLLMDSLTRFAMAQREIGLAVGSRRRCGGIRRRCSRRCRRCWSGRGRRRRGR